MIHKLTSNVKLFSLSLVLFFTWGFVTLLNDILIPVLKQEIHLNYFAAMFIQFSFFLAYGIMSIPMAKLLDKLSYKLSIGVGLLVIGAGCLVLIFAHLSLFFILVLIGLFIIATGIVILQVAANLLVTLLGEQDTSSARLTLAQAINSSGYVIAPVVVAMIPLAKSLSVVYMGIVIAMVVFSVVFLRSDFSSLTRLTEATVTDNTETAGSTRIPYLAWLGIISIFVYVGAEVSAGSLVVNFIHLPEIGNLTIEKATKYLSIYWGGAMVGRFIGSYVLTRVNAKLVLLIYSLCNCFLLMLTCILSGGVAMWTLLSLGFFNSIMFPTIYALTVSDIRNSHLKSKVSGLLITAIIGGAIVPVLQGVVADLVGLQFSFIFLVLCYLFIAVFSYQSYKQPCSNAIITKVASH